MGFQMPVMHGCPSLLTTCLWFEKVKEIRFEILVRPPSVRIFATRVCPLYSCCQCSLAFSKKHQAQKNKKVYSWKRTMRFTYAFLYLSRFELKLGIGVWLSNYNAEKGGLSNCNACFSPQIQCRFFIVNNSDQDSIEQSRISLSFELGVSFIFELRRTP